MSDMMKAMKLQEEKAATAKAAKEASKAEEVKKAAGGKAE